MTLTPTELAVLGLVIEQPRHGYELEEVIERRGIRQWTDVAFSSIYYVLNKLEKRGLATSDARAGNARSRRVFRATQRGRDIATSTAIDLIATNRPVPHSFLVGLANKALVSESAYHEALRARLSQVDARITRIAEAERSQAPLPSAADEVFSFSLALLKAERTWLAQRARHNDE